MFILWEDISHSRFKVMIGNEPVEHVSALIGVAVFPSKVEAVQWVFFLPGHWVSDNPQDPEPISNNSLHGSPARKFSADFSRSFAAPAVGCGVGRFLARGLGSSGRAGAPTGHWEGSWGCLMAPRGRGKPAGTLTLFSSQWFVVLELTVPTTR